MPTPCPPSLRYKCDGCKSYVAADKSTRIEAAPHNLNICLKRFAVSRRGCCGLAGCTPPDVYHLLSHVCAVHPGVFAFSITRPAFQLN